MTSPDHRSTSRGMLLIVLFATLSAVVAGQVSPRETAPSASVPGIDRKFLDALGIRYELVVRTEPRPLRIHRLIIDLTNPRVEIVAVPADDPDGDGPANATLTPPMTLAGRARALALVNANRWQSLPDAEGKRHTNWREGLPVEALGLIVAGGAVRGAPDTRHCGFYVDRAGTPHVGNPADAKDAREAVAGLPRLLDAGNNLLLAAPDDPVHPRTALGLTPDARTLVIVVVNGRQKGYSEGMSCFELAECMRSLGCSDAVNLDGGGSSVLILSDANGGRRIVNDPSTKQDGISVARPIPVALVLRERK